jgi:hypothetical protein
MKRSSLALLIAFVISCGSSAARQTAPSDQRLFFRVRVPPGQNAKLVLPNTNSIELSALNMWRDENLVMHLEGDVEIRFSLSPGPAVAVLRSVEGTYDPKTAELRLPGPFQMTEEHPR